MRNWLWIIPSVILFSLLTSLVVAGGSPKPPAVEKSQVADLISKQYAAAKTMTADVKKVVESQFTDSSKYSGGMKVKGQNLRLELKGTQHTLQIYKEGELTKVTFPDGKFKDQKIQVAKFTIDTNAEVFRMISSLLKGQELDRKFDVIESKSEDGSNRVTLKPSAEGSQLSKVALLIDKEKLIRELSYWDELENEVKFEFSKIKFDQKVEDKEFEYVAPEGSEKSQF